MIFLFFPYFLHFPKPIFAERNGKNGRANLSGHHNPMARVITGPREWLECVWRDRLRREHDFHLQNVHRELFSDVQHDARHESIFSESAPCLTPAEKTQKAQKVYEVGDAHQWRHAQGDQECQGDHGDCGDHSDHGDDEDMEEDRRTQKCIHDKPRGGSFDLYTIERDIRPKRKSRKKRTLPRSNRRCV